MPQTPIDAVEFVGGPFDGLLQFVDSPIDELKQHVAAPVNQYVIATLTEPCVTPAEPATSVALYEIRYELRHELLIPYYAHLGSVSINRFQSELRAR